MSMNEEGAPPAALSREELVALVSRAHLGSSTADGQAAASALAAQSKLPTRVAQNLGAGFGQWDFFPEIADIVDFALRYVPPQTDEDLWALARAWSADEAASRHTILALVGRDILSHELRRIAVPALRELIDEHRPQRLRELKVAHGLDVRPLPPAAKPAPKRAAPPTSAPAPASAAPAAKPKDGAPGRMPKPERRPRAAAPKVPDDARRFEHPKFGKGVLEAQLGEGPDAKLTIRFESGPKTVLARYVTELPSEP